MKKGRHPCSAAFRLGGEEGGGGGEGAERGCGI